MKFIKTAVWRNLVKGFYDTHKSDTRFLITGSAKLDLLAQILPERVGAPLSLNNLKQDLMVAFETVDRWITILENLYFCFRIKPFGLPHLRAVKKEQKLCLWDWSLCEDQSARFENMVASYLLKYCHFHEDHFGDRMELQFIRDQSKREIDFVVVKENRPLFAVECKSGQGRLSSNIAYFAKRSSIPLFYQVHLKDKDYVVQDAKARVLPFTRFCEIMEL